jgi:hypothetical protein
MIKYETNNVKWNRELDGDEFWTGADGGDVLMQVVNRPKYYDSMKGPGIEEKLENLVRAVGKIADKTGINLLEVFQEDERRLQYRLQTGE